MRWLAVAIMLVAGSACGASPETEAESATNNFYRVYMKLKLMGIPSSKQLRLLQKTISPGMAGLLLRADDAESKYARNTKGEVPPLIEGDLFTSNFEGATSFKVLRCEARGGSMSCTVELGYPDSRSGKIFNWQDRAVLIEDHDKWLVDDIEFLGSWEFMHKGFLREILNQIILDADRTG